MTSGGTSRHRCYHQEPEERRYLYRVSLRCPELQEDVVLSETLWAICMFLYPVFSLTHYCCRLYLYNCSIILDNCIAGLCLSETWHVLACTSRARYHPRLRVAPWTIRGHDDRLPNPRDFRPPQTHHCHHCYSTSSSSTSNLTNIDIFYATRDFPLRGMTSALLSRGDNPPRAASVLVQRFQSVQVQPAVSFRITPTKALVPG